MIDNRTEADRALLRRFEPVIHYTRGETFFPMDAETYVRECSLWVERPNEDPVCLVPAGELTLDKLAEERDDPLGSLYFLKFIDPLNIAEMAAFRIQDITHRDPDLAFHAGRGRLARVGYVARLVDAIFTLTLLARGRVPGDTAAAAVQVYKALQKKQEKYTYHGRVVRQNGWVALQYWFLYPYNNWRSGFFGANDHESDWETIYVYLAPTEHEGLKPEWVAYAAHDFSGDDLRRRWDDPEVQKLGEHPIIYAGAGSHAAYFVPGEYLPTIELPFLAAIARLTHRFQEFWQHTIRQTRDEDPDNAIQHRNSLDIFRIPFVDYARGDGISIGPEQERSWDEPILLDPIPNWAFHYRGLWGLFARDPFSGENAPAGPLYNRDGSMRRSWYDPLGWSGLDKVLPPNHAQEATRKQIATVDDRRRELAEQIASKEATLTGLALEATAMQEQPHLKTQYASHAERVTEVSDELKDLRQQYAENDTLLEALSHHAAHLRAGERGPARAHIRHAHYPATDTDLRLGRIAEAWAATSIGVLMISMVLVFFFYRQYMIIGLVVILAIFLFIEAGARRRLVNLITTVTNALTIVTALVLFYQFFWAVVMLVVLLAGVYIIWENIRELGT